MKEEITNRILQRMLPMLDNRQLSALRDVLRDAFAEVEMSSYVLPDSEETDAVDAFISAKRVEGCSEKTLKYYQRTIEALITAIQKAPERITTADLREYLTTYQNERRSSKVTIDNIRRILSSFFS